MRFKSISIRNFRAVAYFHADDLQDLVVIAGPNGCGKSCILDSLRLLKSVYGGYQANEYMQWFGEFQINPGDPSTLGTMFRDPGQSLAITAEMRLADEEIRYLVENAERLCELLLWTEVTNTSPEQLGGSPLAYAAQFPFRAAEVAGRLPQLAEEFTDSVSQPIQKLGVVIPPGGLGIEIEDNVTARVLFQTFEPSHLGILDFHGANRTYAREGVGGVNLDARAATQQRRTQSLYNWQGKYNNIKSELLAAYLRGVLPVAGAGSEDISSDVAALQGQYASLDTTLQELFTAFFPDKKYLGVQMDRNGNVEFPVEVAGGGRHDMNELSSGEKEVLYGYLRLRNSTPRHSTILLDEPEMHLNPALLRNFPAFYHKHLVDSNQNQLWLVTHSDTLLREAVGNPQYSVYHMTSASNVLAAGDNQASAVAEDEIEAALLDLVGDLAAYQPTAKVVILEGKGEGGFDVKTVQRLFPKFAEKINLVSGGDKRSALGMREGLSSAAAQTGQPDRFYAVTDRDFDATSETVSQAVFSWNVYHIENYLLAPKYLLQINREIRGGDGLLSEEEVLASLRKHAEASIDKLVLQVVQDRVNGALISSINIGAHPDSSDPAKDLLPALGSSLTRFQTAAEAFLAGDSLNDLALEARRRFTTAIEDGSWLEVLPGRPILKAFVHSEFGGDISYTGTVNSIISRMVADQYEPEGMKRTLQKILPSL